ncbi:MAG TPA: hypothetical protein VFD28_02620, partial [Candidatus Eisenbacteria bacterium]|nr:hypothetical protein [Candidatus Eisenbacteria bacterium]
VRAGASVSVTYGTSKQYNDYLNPTESTRSDITMPVFVGSTWDKTYSTLNSWGAATPSISVQYISQASREQANHENNPGDAYVLEQSVASGTNINDVAEILFVLGTYQDYQNQINPTTSATTSETTTVEVPTSQTTSSPTSQQAEPPATPDD